MVEHLLQPFAFGSLWFQTQTPWDKSGRMAQDNHQTDETLYHIGSLELVHHVHHALVPLCTAHN